MKSFLLILFASFGYLCFGHVPETEDQTDALFLDAAQLLCNSGEETSLCDPAKSH